MSRHRPHGTAGRAIAAVTVAAILVGCSSSKSNPPRAREPGVENFRWLQEGMTREQAEAVLGGAEKHLGSPKRSVAATLWQWKGEGGAMEPRTDSTKPPSDGPWTYGRLLGWTEQYLAQKGCEFPRLDAQVLLAQVLGCKRIELYTRYEEPATEEERARFKELIRKRLEGCPVAYLVGRKEFFSLEFEVGPAVLIPRPDTETLVNECLALAKPLAAPRLLDVGTGSGAIAVALAKRHTGADVTATDVSPDALAVARRNAEKHGLGGRIRFLAGDLFESIAPEERFDFILSNPPYIAREDIPSLPVGVRDYEPHLALDGGPGGYAVFDRLIREAPRYLKPGGYLVVEIGSPQEGPARQRIEAIAGYELAATIKDGSGHPRVLRARWRG